MTAAGASGPHKGIRQHEWAKSRPWIPWECAALLSSTEASGTLLVELKTVLDTHDALDLLDVKELKDSWAHAGAMNARHGD